EQVTAGVTVVSGRAPPCRASAVRCGASRSSKSSVRPTTLRTRTRFIRIARGVHDRGLTAKDRVALPKLTLIDERPVFRGVKIEATGLAEEVHGIVPDDSGDGAVRYARLNHRLRCFRHLQRIAHAPVRRAV